jgi:hypothetical protein
MAILGIVALATAARINGNRGANVFCTTTWGHLGSPKPGYTFTEWGSGESSYCTRFSTSSIWTYTYITTQA